MNELRGRIAELEQQLQAERMGRELAQRQFERVLGKLNRLREAVANAIAGNWTRPRATPYRDDGRPSKLDKCPHGWMMYEDCEECMCDFLQQAMEEPG